ncbi:DUF3017 domain-containing protein [Saccharopolyspora sp. HNM0983]|uniref:DUF3017 domain-containing protein n=1 Tax=Saccharopolyspora montiporae TaxID=2781240 RepID=A0A929BBM9_9PSEU|nr:DUF3017 domain-containing protein [Saccharopolyspora sp. HNM0983]MBE9375103.1 DUF3017 domain-containing protein [Saccharopolyspora sp. HNM0983]
MSERPDLRARLSVHAPFALVLLVVLVGFLRIAGQHWREGSVLLGCALLLAAGLRGLVQQERLGLLVIRSRVVDVLLYGALGLVIIAIAMTIRGGPFG